MDPQVQASFIPKKSLDPAASRGGGYGIFFLIALLIFVSSLVAAGGSFLYKEFLSRTLAAKKADLSKSQGAYEPNTIQNLARMDLRIAQSKVVMGKHISSTAFFDFLSTQTLERVSFGDFSLKLEPDGSGKIEMTGSADNFSTMALQSDQFGGCRLLRDVVFSGISVGDGGRVSFSVKASVDPGLLLYSNKLKPESAPQCL